MEAPSPTDSLHADGRRDGVADGDADEVGVLDAATEGDPGAAEVGPDGVHVGVVALASVRVAGAVALGEQRGGVVGDEGEEQHGGGAGHPAELRDGPGQGEHAGADHGGDDVRARRPERAGAAWPPVVVEILGRVAVPGLHGDLHRREVLGGAAVVRRHRHVGTVVYNWELAGAEETGGRTQRRRRRAAVRRGGWMGCSARLLLVSGGGGV